MEARVAKFGPDVIVLEPNTAVVDRVLVQAERFQAASSAKIVLAGAHASACARELLEANPQVDFVWLGEYESVALSLLQVLRDGGDFASLAGVACRLDDGQVRLNRHAAPIEPLDSLPPPAHHLLPAPSEPDMSLYRDGFCQYAPAFHMHTSRGCPYRCNFCVWVQVLYRNGPQRLFSPARVVDEMQMLVDRFAAAEIYFDDDNFTANRSHVRALCSEIARRNLSVKWSSTLR